MAKLAAKSLLGVVVACVASGVLSAQDPQAVFKEAVQLLRLNKKEEALAKFQEVVRLDPTNAQAWKLWSETDKNIWEELVLSKDAEIRKIAQHLMGRARLARKKMSRDDAVISDLAKKACSADYNARFNAVTSLRADHGEFAVPALLTFLGNVDDEKGQSYATIALKSIGRVVTLPLIEALDSDNNVLRRNIVGVINLLGDHRAIPALTRLVANDKQEAVKEVAAAALRRMNATATGSAKDRYLAQGLDYLIGTNSNEDPSEVLWTFADGKLTHKDISPLVYYLELAKRDAERALSLNPEDPVAQALVARCYLAEVATINDAAGLGDESGLALKPLVPQLRMVAMATGPQILRKALLDSLRDRQPMVAVAAIEALGDAEDKDALATSPLVGQLRNPNKAVAYAAALALVKASRGSAIPQAGRVVNVLAEAVAEEAVRRIHLVGDTKDFKGLIEAGAHKRGQVRDGSFTGRDHVRKMYAFADVDVLVINETLPDMIPETLIGLVRKNPRNKDIKILIVAVDTEKAGTRYGDTIHGVIAGPISGDALNAAVDKALEGVKLDTQRQRANAVAVAASNALLSLAKARVNVADAVARVAGQLDRADEISITAAQMLGEAGTLSVGAAALVKAIQGGGSVNLKIASAQALGQILGRSPEVPVDIYTALRAVAIDAKADMKLRQAVVTALGKGKLVPGNILELIKALNTVAIAGADDGSEN